MTLLDVAVIGSRTITSYEALETTLSGAPAHWMEDPRFISGGADGVDTLAEHYARRNDIPIEIIEPDWSDWSNGHPAIGRNAEIVEQADVVVALWDGKSNGTRDTIEKALDRGTAVYVEVM